MTSQPFQSLELDGKRCLLLASAGGHLAQMSRLLDAINLDPNSVLVTFEGPQADALRQKIDVVTIPYIAPRDVRGVLRGARIVRREAAARKSEVAVSTGAAIALAGLPQFALPGRRSAYVESFSRFDGPSLSGRILRWLPGVETYTQHRSWAKGAWKYDGNVLDVETPVPTRGRAVTKMSGAPSIFVTLGTIRPYRFDALVDRVLECLPPEATITWQLGSTTRGELPGITYDEMPVETFVEVAGSSDLVITHGGLGTALTLASLDCHAILVPRRAARAEHIDDHQIQVCREFSRSKRLRYLEVDAMQPRDLAVVAQ